jgi:sugar phosphate isomerase/epimerase
MHLSMHNWMRAEPIEVTIRRLAKFDYGSIEIGGEPEQYDTGEVRGLLDEHDIECWGAVTLMLEDRNLVAGKEADRAASVQYVKDCVTMTKELDGQVVDVVPGTVGKIEPDASPEEEWEWAVEGMKEIYDHAQKEGIRIAIEPINRFETYFITRADQALELAKETGPDCGVALDTFHMNIEERDPYQAIRTAGDRLYDFHVADTNRMPCGHGHWDWPKVIETLESVGYDGALTTEFVAPIDRTPVDPYPEATETEAVEITEEQKKFIEDHGSGLLSEQFYSWLVEENAKTLLPLIQNTE